MRVIVLGSGTSHGVPMIGCECEVCRSPDPRNRRLRPSAAVETSGRTFLIDTTPELRLQALANGLTHVDAVLITHTHADHIFGLDEVRRFNDLSGKEIPVYGDAGALDDIRRIYRYIFTETQAGGGKPRIDLRVCEPGIPIDVFGVRIEPLQVIHGTLPILAFRIGSFAYVTDVNHIPPAAMARLRNLDLLILDAVRFEPHVTHFGLYQALDVVQALQPRQALFTHLSHRFDHAAVNASLPAGTALAFDGQVVEGPDA